MNTSLRHWLLLGVLLVFAIAAGCSRPAAVTRQAKRKPKPVTEAKPPATEAMPPPHETAPPADGSPSPADLGYEDPPMPDGAKEFTKNVYFQKDGNTRRVLVYATVCLREGQLEGLLTKPGREHEYILVTNADARSIHTMLVAAGAQPGSPVKFENDKIVPPTGSHILVSVQYKKQGEVVTVPASKWLRHIKTKKELDLPWVFAGSHFLKDPMGKEPPFYEANAGDIICVCNMSGAMLDLPILNPTALEERPWFAYKSRIPPEGVKVIVILEPDPKDMKKDMDKKEGGEEKPGDPKDK